MISDNLGSPAVPALSPDPSNTPLNGSTMDPDTPPSTGPVPGPATFSPDQLQSLGLVDCQPGDTYTVTLTASGDSPDGGKTFDVVSTEPSAEGGTGGPADGDAAAAAAMPDDSDTENTDDSADPSDEEKMLGYKRQSKVKKFPLPEVDRLRS